MTLPPVMYCPTHGAIDTTNGVPIGNGLPLCNVLIDGDEDNMCMQMLKSYPVTPESSSSSGV